MLQLHEKKSLISIKYVQVDISYLYPTSQWRSPNLIVNIVSWEAWKFLKIFLNIYLFSRDRAWARDRERRRNRIWSRLQAPRCPHRAWGGAQTHKLWDRDLSWSWMLNRLNCPRAPKVWKILLLLQFSEEILFFEYILKTAFILAPKFLSKLFWNSNALCSLNLLKYEIIWLKIRRSFFNNVSIFFTKNMCECKANTEILAMPECSSHN